MRKNYAVPYFEDRVQIRNSCAIFYTQLTSAGRRNYSSFSKPTYSGEITKGSYKRIRMAVDLLLQIAPERIVYNQVLSVNVKHKLAFITLTIPEICQHLTPREGHKLLLEKWLLTMRRKFHMYTYIWKAEYQKNGQLHYHITTPSWILYTHIQDTWNNILSTSGILKPYLEKSKNKMPNSTDVHAVYKVKDLGAYLSKYMAKNVHGETKQEEAARVKAQLQADNLPFEETQIINQVEKEKKQHGKLWDCSKDLKGIGFFSTEQPTNLHEYLDTRNIIYKSHCGILKLPNLLKKFPDRVQTEYKEWLNDKRANIHKMINETSKLN